MNTYLRNANPPKRIVKKKDDADGAATPAKKKRKTAAAAAITTEDVTSTNGDTAAAAKPAKPAAPKRGAAKKKALGKAVPTPSPSEEDSDPLSSLGEDEDGDEGGDVVAAVGTKRRAAVAPARKRSGRVSQRVSYKEENADEMSM